MRAPTRTPWRRWSVLPLLLLALSCGRDETDGTSSVGDDPASPTAGTHAMRVDVPTTVRWLNSGVIMRDGQLVELEASTASGNHAGGSPVPNGRAPVPIYGEDGLIGRIGERGFPFPILDRVVLQGSSETEGQTLYLGRNNAPPEPFLSEVTSTDPATDDVEGAREVVIDYDAQAYEVGVRLRTTDAPALLIPVDGFYDSQQNPIFRWDEIDSASQYTLEISDFPDFRRVIFSVNVATTSINTAAITVDPNNPTAPVTPNLVEGLYYWRVRAQVNTGTLLNPRLVWTDRSPAFKLGVELGDATGTGPDAPTLLTPSQRVIVNADSVIPFEIASPSDASGLLWRYMFFHGQCGDTVSSDAADIAELLSPWMVFQQSIQTNQIDEPRRHYGAFVSPVLDEGEWLLRVETRDGADENGARVAALEYDFTAGCQ